MTREEKTEYLSKYRIQQAKINRLNFQIAAIPANREKYETQIKECEKIRNKIEDAIDSVDGGVLSEILAEKFISGRKIEEIAEMISYSVRQTERLLKKALETLCFA